MAATKELQDLKCGEIVRKYRQFQGLRLQDLSDMTGLQVPYIGALERGELIPGVLNMGKLAKALGVTTAHLLGEVPFLEPWPKED